MTFIKMMMGLCGLTATLTLAGGCTDYTYFNVNVSLSQQDKTEQDRKEMIDSRILEDMDSCSIAAYSGGRLIEMPKELTKQDGVESICKPRYYADIDHVGDIKVMKVGVLDYSSARNSGDIKFLVTVTTGKPAVTIGQGSAVAGVSPGKVLEVPLIVKACAHEGHPNGQEECIDSLDIKPE
jgi:hypothetical protein